MTIFPKTPLLAAFAAAVFATGAQAQQFVQMAICTDSGCTCSVSRRTVEDVAAALPIPIPEGAEDMVILRKPDGSFAWTGMAPADLDLLYGGPGSCPLQVFDEFTPEDGLWQITAGATDTSACQMLRGQAIPGGMSGETRRIVWNGRFHPDTLLMESHGMVRWSETGRLAWRGVVVDESLSGAGGSTSASVVHTMRMVSPTEITGSTVFEYDISANTTDAAAQAMLAGLACRTVTPFVARRVE